VRVVIFGANGCLGSELRLLLGERAKCFGRDVDITNQRHVFSAVGEHVDVVINCAAYTDVQGAEHDSACAYRVNAVGAQNVALAARRRMSLLVHLSTDAVFDGYGYGLPNDELAQTSPRGVYGRSKLLGEHLVRDADCRHVIVRTCNLYGRHGKGFRSQILAKLRTDEVLRVEGKRVVAPTWAKIVATAVLTLAVRHATMPGRGLYHVSCSGETTWLDFARLAATKLGVKKSIGVYPPTGWRGGGPPHGLLTSVLLPVLGIEMPTWEQALDQCLVSDGA